MFGKLKMLLYLATKLRDMKIKLQEIKGKKVYFKITYNTFEKLFGYKDKIRVFLDSGRVTLADGINVLYDDKGNKHSAFSTYAYLYTKQLRIKELQDA